MKDVKLPDKFFDGKRPIASKKCVNARHVMKFFKLEPGEYLIVKFFKLEPGEYLIVPSTFNPKESAKFILSIFSKSESHRRNEKPEMTYV